MRIGNLLAVLAIILLLLAIQIPHGLPLLWPGIDLLTLGIAYHLNWHQVFGKTSNGSLPLWSWLLFGPLHIYTNIVWHLFRQTSREHPFNSVTETLIIGRRLLPDEMEVEYDNIVDLTAEFSEPASIRHRPSYRSFPILDCGAPTAEQLLVVVRSLRPGRTYVHCALGHGRTGLFALAVLLEAGVVRSVDDGLRLLQTARPGIRLNTKQNGCNRQFAELVASSPELGPSQL